MAEATMRVPFINRERRMQRRLRAVQAWQEEERAAAFGRLLELAAGTPDPDMPSVISLSPSPPRPAVAG